MSLFLVAAVVIAVWRTAEVAFASHGVSGVYTARGQQPTRTSLRANTELDFELARAQLQRFSEAETLELDSQIDGLSEDELKARKDKALDLWESLKPDVADELGKYMTFRVDKFEAFIRTDSRGIALLKIYKPGTPEYRDFFEAEMGPFLFELAKDKLGEGLTQAAIVIGVVLVLFALGAVFGTDIVQRLTAPFTGYAEEFVQLYGF